MPLTAFKCPDGVTRPVKDCLNHCPLPDRCLSLPTLYELGKTRDYFPSTTQLLNPTRQEYLKITKPFAIDPFDHAFQLLGTRHHHLLDAVAKQVKEVISEKQLGGDISGILDLLEPDDNNGQWKLIDYKTWGSYALLDFLIPDSFKRLEVARQLNHYRVKVEVLEFPISKLQVQCTIRDGHTKSAYMNGVQDTIRKVDVDFLPDVEVLDFFERKGEALMCALATKTLPLLCDFDERWQGKKCKGSFCEVHQFCPEGAKINRVTLEV